MNRPLWRLGGGVLAVALLLSGASAAQAASAPASSVHAAAVTATDQQRVARFWTPERMRSATPMDLLALDGRTRLGQARRGTAAKVDPTPAAFPNGGSAWTGAGAVTRTVGRVFFTFTGRTASCSGTAVTSTNKSVVITAGHCVKMQGAWHTNWVFVPGYNNGNTPYGTWTAKQTMATSQWAATENISYDLGAAVVNPLNGQRLTDVVGGQGIAFNQTRGQNMYAFGYPAGPPYDGSKLIYCSGKVFNEFLGTGDIGMTCNMTGGSSGGPWFLQFAEATGAGTVNSVNSFKYNFAPNWMFGPYFGADAQTLHNSAQAA
jgi:V8-like Glu-specific endopeptidase